jgi:transposase-like protein
MARDPTALTKYEAALAALRCEFFVDHHDDADIDKAAAALDRIVRRRNGGHSTQADPVRVDGMAAPSANSDKYRGMSISEAAAAYLKDVGHEMSVADVVEALIRDGFEVTAERPSTALTTALDRRSANFNDVVKIRYGVWCHADNLTDKQRAALEHKKRTSLGMQRRKARGLSVGQPAKITPQIEGEIERMIINGKRVKEIAQRFGVTDNAIYNRFNAARLAELRALSASGDDPDESDPASHLRVVSGREKK